MRRGAFLLLIAAILPAPLPAQELVSTLSLTAEGGYLTNTYLHPVLPVWVPVESSFVGLAPAATLAWSDERTYARVEGQLRLSRLAEQTGAWWMGTSRTRLYHRLGRTFGVGLDGSASRIQLGTRQWLAWSGPFVTVRVARGLRVTLQSGASFRRYEAVGTSPGRTHGSYFSVAQAGLGVGAHWNFGGHAYASYVPATAMRSFGLGAWSAYQWSRRFSLGVQASAERYGPESASWQSSAYAEGPMSGGWSWTGRVGVQQLTGTARGDMDVFAAVAVTYNLRYRRNLKPPAPDFWEVREGRMVLHLSYDGGGDLYLVGDFNNWEQGSMALLPGSGNSYVVPLDLEPGTYEYKIMVVEDDEWRWVSLPEHALTTDDGFGGTNGILLVE